MIPARCFVFAVRSLPFIFSVFSTAVVMLLCVFRNFLVFRIFVIHKVFLGNFRIAMLPKISCGIFFGRFASFCLVLATLSPLVFALATLSPLVFALALLAVLFGVGALRRFVWRVIVNVVCEII